MNILKKLSVASLGAATFLTVTAPAFAQQDINPCPNAGGGLESLCNSGNTDINTVLQRIVFYLLLGAIIIALFFLIWGGIRWIMSGGDKTKVEAARGTIIGAIIGLIIALAAYFILNLVVTYLTGTSITGLQLPTLFNK